jgi:hypothetical protein
MPAPEKCLTQAIVYQDEVKSYDNGETKRYIGVTAGEFKDRYRNHKKSFELQRYANETELSKHIWKLNSFKEKRKTLQHHLVHS